MMGHSETKSISTPITSSVKVETEAFVVETACPSAKSLRPSASSPAMVRTCMASLKKSFKKNLHDTLYDQNWHFGQYLYISLCYIEDKW
jgi:hypothetical protein